jgi:DNA-binding helix-hairpin-helix protein with protein kinase domain
MRVTLKGGGTLECDDEPFDRGGDGRVHWAKDGKSLVKFFHTAEPWRLQSLEAVLTRFNAVKGEPYWEELFAWPAGIVEKPGLGIVMPRAASGLVKVANLIRPSWLNRHPEDIGNWEGRLWIAIKLARAVKRLHFMGLCHSDLSDNNILASPHDGRAYVIDCDGVVVPGLVIGRPIVIGTPGYMAPEIVANTSLTPSVITDLHALAVLIYQILLIRHPLDGRKVHDMHDPEADDRYKFGERALFIEHPSDPSNRPTRLDWRVDVLGAAGVRIMNKAFVDGLHQSSRRPQAAEWERALFQIADTLVTCLNQHCPLKRFPLPEQIGRTGSVHCPWCGTPFRGVQFPVLRWCNPVPNRPGMYREDGTRLVAALDRKLFEWHIKPNMLPSPTSNRAPLAFFHWERDGRGVGRWMLANEALPYFEAADPGKQWQRIRARDVVMLEPQRKLRFGPPGFARDAVVEILTLA